MRERLRQARLANDLTQEELAHKLNNSKIQISRWENGKTVPCSDLLIELSKVLNVSTDYLLGVSDEPTIRQRIDNLSIEEMLVIAAMRNGNDNEALKIIVNRDKRPHSAV